MAGISDYLANYINDWLHGSNVALTPPATTYFALMTVMPTSAGGGTEVTGGSYARLAVTNNSTNWPASSSGIKSNGIDLTWITPTADWGMVVGVAEYDAATDGNLLTFATLAVSTLVLDGQPFSIPIGSGVFSWAGGISTYLADRLNDWLHGGGVYTVPATTYFALMTDPPTQAGGGTETSGTGYARSNESNDSTEWPDAVAQSKTNAATIDWGPAGASWSGPEVGVAEYDAAAAGNLLTFGSLGTEVTVASGASPQIPVGAATYQVS